jgi:serine/threonine protein phosphatase 1
MTAPPEGFERICLMGNHEAMMLQFLADPSPDSMWLSQGGMQTLMSYGVSETMLQGAGRRALRQMIEAYVPTEHLVFLRNMPVLLETPEHLFVHAGIDRTVAISEQPDDILLWYRDDLVETYDGLGRQVVHGHTFTPEPLLSPFRVAIDTGAYHTGTLTAAAFSPGKVPRIINVVATQGSP